MRGLPLVLVLATVGIARAESDATLHVQPFSGRCFDAGKLVERLRARGIKAELGGRGGQMVELATVPDGVTVRVTARDTTGEVSGIEQRHVADGPCESVTETVELILTRAATPLHFMADAPPAPVPKKTPPHHKEPPPVATPIETPTPTQTPSPSPIENPTPIASPTPIPISIPTRDDPPPAAPISSRPRVRPVLKGELAVHGAWVFPLDHAPSEPMGDLELGLRWSKHLGIAIEGGVAKAWHSADHSGDSAASIDVRRIPLALLLTIDAPLPRGRMRIDVGPEVNVWLVRSRGVSDPGTSTLAQPALAARCAYRYDVKRAFFEGGVALDVAILREDLKITGVGALSHTPVVDAAPFVGVGMTL